MIWSYSSSRTFTRCQKQWYYEKKFAHHKATRNPLRREAYLLSKLQTLDEWRGSLVDFVISEHIVKGFNKKNPLDLRAALQVARRAFDRQVNFAYQQRLREPGLDITGLTKQGEFAAFYELEYPDEPLTDTHLELAWRDVKRSLTNFFAMQSLLAELRRARYLIAQRTLYFYPTVFLAEPSQKFSATAIPDLLVFFWDEPPLIVDWKVNTFGTRDHRMQLATYAVALSQIKPHTDFPELPSPLDPTSIRLAEIQLLTNQHRIYTLTPADIEGVEDYIARTATDMLLALAGETDESALSTLPVTDYADHCMRCPYRQLCW